MHVGELNRDLKHPPPKSVFVREGTLWSLCTPHPMHFVHLTGGSVRATSDNMNKQKARENLRYIYVMNEYVHT
jgi:hypothetical protein